MTSIYKEIAEINKYFLNFKAIQKKGIVSRETELLLNESFDSLKNDIKSMNNKIWNNLKNNYEKDVFVNYSICLHIDNFDKESLLELHDKEKFVFNTKCLELNTNHFILYINKENKDYLLEKLNNIALRPIFIIEEKYFKNKTINRNEKSYRKKIFNSLLLNKNKKDVDILINWFSKN